MKRILAALLLLTLAAPAWGQDFEKGMQAYQRGEQARQRWDFAAAVRNYAAALRELRPLADQGDAESQYMLGEMYGNGQGLPKDFSEAVKWYRKAAEQGNANAQNNLGGMYGNGQGVTQDYVQAHMWYNLAVSKSPPGEDRDKAVKNRDLLAKMMTPAQISEAQKLAREWKPKK